MNHRPIKRRVGFFQFAPRFGDVTGNCEQVVSALKSAKADIVVLPELPFTGYGFKDRRELRSLAEDPSRSATVDRLTALCRDREFYLVSGFAEKKGRNLFNSALLIGPRGVAATYRKLHLFNTEKNCFDAGDTGLAVAEIRGMRVGLMVCFDWAFPEVARVLALKGADLICHPANLVLAYCQQAMLTRSLENGVFAVTANRCGTEDHATGRLTFTGQSQVVAPDGALIHRAAAEGDALVVVEIDLARARDKAITEQNHLLADRRPQFYRDLSALPKAPES